MNGYIQDFAHKLNLKEKKTKINKRKKEKKTKWTQQQLHSNAYRMIQAAAKDFKQNSGATILHFHWGKGHAIREKRV